MLSSMTVTIYHNPQCGTSRNVLALIRNAGIDPESSSTSRHHRPGKGCRN